MDTDIDDIRDQKTFRDITFSNFKKTEVKRVLEQSIYDSKIEPACYWSAELVCSGHYIDLWDICIGFYSKYIHIGNPKLVIYMDMRLKLFRSLLRNGYVGMELRLRNHDQFRTLFCEMICILCYSKRKHCFTEVKVKKDDFDLTQMTERFKAPNVLFIDDVFLENDPKELFIALNEFAYNLTDDVRGNVSACYWLEWILEFGHICKQKREKVVCERRIFAAVEPKYQMDIIWLVWDIFLTESNKRNSPFYRKIVECALNLFCFNYTQTCYKKRRSLVYFIIELFTEQVSFDEEIFKNKETIASICKNVNKIYKQIKVNEVSPRTSYLYKNIKSDNLTKTMEKLETLNNLGVDSVPRLKNDDDDV